MTSKRVAIPPAEIAAAATPELAAALPAGTPDTDAADTTDEPEGGQ